MFKVTSDNMPLDELAKVVCKLEAVKLSTNTLQNLSTLVDAVNKTRANHKTRASQKQCGKVANYGGTMVEAKEVAGLN